MKYSELNNEDNITDILLEHWHMDDDSLLPPMFHGTDYSLIGLTKQERERINCSCEYIINSLFNMLRENSVDVPNETLSSIVSEHDNAADAFINARERLRKNLQYRYGDLYVTSDPYRAAGYSKEAWIFGETGETANMLVKGTIALGFDLPKNEGFIKAYSVLEERRKMPKDPVVLMITDCSYSGLYSVGGENIKANEKLYLPNGIKYLKRNRDVDSFILDEKTLNNAGLYVIKQKLYGNLINTYENISFQ